MVCLLSTKTSYFFLFFFCAKLKKFFFFFLFFSSIFLRQKKKIKKDNHFILKFLVSFTFLLCVSLCLVLELEYIFITVSHLNFFVLSAFLPRSHEQISARENFNFFSCGSCLWLIICVCKLIAVVSFRTIWVSVKYVFWQQFQLVLCHVKNNTQYPRLETVRIAFRMSIFSESSKWKDKQTNSTDTNHTWT